MICWIKLGTMLEGLINIITLGNGTELASWIAWKFFKSTDCGCQRRKDYLNSLTCKNYESGIKIQ